MADQGRYVLVGLGEILWDVFPTGKQLGGAPANFAYHARALGARGVPVSCIGDDMLGREILDRLKELRLPSDYIAVDSEHPTGTVTIEVDDKGKPTYTIHENVAWDFIPWSGGLAELAAGADAVCFGSLCQRRPVSRATIHNFLEVTKPDCIRVFDINLRQSYFSKEVIQGALERSDVLKLNDEELPVLGELLGLGGAEGDIVSRVIEKYGLRVVALTRGPKGSELYTAGKVSKHGAFPTEVVDTVGAGDAFTAAITMGLLYHRTLDEINDFANRLAAFVCSQSGATPKLPDAIANHWIRRA